MKYPRKQNTAFTLIELLVVIAVIAMLAVSWVPALAYGKPKARLVVCSNNLKQVGLAFRIWASDHNGNTPMTVAQALGGAAEDVGYRALGTDQQSSRGVSKMFLCMSNELSTPKILFCPAEYEIAYRQPAATFAEVAAPGTAPYTNDLNVSYFIGVDAMETSPQLLLAGDHNLGGNANPPDFAYCAAPSTYTPGYALWLGTNFNNNQGPAFMANQHDQQGNIALADGSVQGCSRSQFQDALKKSGDRGRAPGTNFKPATGVGSLPGPGCNRIQLP